MSSLVSPLDLSRNKLFWELMHPTIRKDRSKGIFAGIIGTGIENSDPQVGERRRNQLEEAGGSVYNHLNLRGRLERIRSLNVNWVRMGEGYSFRHAGIVQYDFRLTEVVERECARLGITLIDDRLHFGLPDWMHHKTPHQPYFQNPEWPYHFAEFNREVTRRHPTPYITYVNEPLVTALFSSGYGMWNERRKDERSLVNAMVNIARAMVLASVITLSDTECFKKTTTGSWTTVG